MIHYLIHAALAAFATFEAWQAAKRLRFQVLKTLVFGGIAVIHGYVPILATPWYERTGQPYEVHVDAAWFALCGTVLLSIGWRTYHTLFPLVPARTAAEYFRLPDFQRRLEIVFVFCMVGGFVSWAGGILASGASLREALTLGRLELRGEGNGLLQGLFSQIFFLAYVPGFIAPLMRGRYRKFGVIYGGTLGILLFVASRGTRASAIGLIGASICGLLYTTRVSLGKLIGAGCALAAIAFLAVGMMPLRHRMSSMTYGDMAAFLISPEAYQDALTQDPLNYHDNLVAIMEIFPLSEPYVDAATYRRILFFYLPGERFPRLKPRDPNRTVAEALFGDVALEVGWMHPPGIFGDVYLNFWGWRGIGAMALQGMCLAWMSRQITYRPWFLVAIGPQVVYFVMIGIRGQPYTIATNVISGLLVTKLLFVITGLRSKLPRPRQRQAPVSTAAPRLARAA